MLKKLKNDRRRLEQFAKDYTDKESGQREQNDLYHWEATVLLGQGVRKSVQLVP